MDDKSNQIKSNQILFKVGNVHLKEKKISKILFAGAILIDLSKVFGFCLQQWKYSVAVIMDANVYVAIYVTGFKELTFQMKEVAGCHYKREFHKVLTSSWEKWWSWMT